MDIAGILGKADIFKGLSPDELAKLSRIARLREFREGETIFGDRDEGRTLYVVAEGVIDIVKPARGGGEARLARLRPGQIFGELSVFDEKPRSAGAKARLYEKTQLLAFDKKDLDALFEEDLRLGLKLHKAMIRKIAERLRESDEVIKDLGPLYSCWVRSEE
jgi:CRP/FNR family cyclic AMP-dependent transcriptional regulator